MKFFTFLAVAALSALSAVAQSETPVEWSHVSNFGNNGRKGRLMNLEGSGDDSRYLGTVEAGAKADTDTQLWALVEDETNPGCYALVCKAFPDGSVVSRPKESASLTAANTVEETNGFWLYNTTERDYGFVLDMTTIGTITDNVRTPFILTVPELKVSGNDIVALNCAVGGKNWRCNIYTPSRGAGNHSDAVTWQLVPQNLEAAYEIKVENRLAESRAYVSAPATESVLVGNAYTIADVATDYFTLDANSARQPGRFMPTASQTVNVTYDKAEGVALGYKQAVDLIDNPQETLTSGECVVMTDVDLSLKPNVVWRWDPYSGAYVNTADPNNKLVGSYDKVYTFVAEPYFKIDYVDKDGSVELGSGTAWVIAGESYTHPNKYLDGEKNVNGVAASNAAIDAVTGNMNVTFNYQGASSIDEVTAADGARGTQVYDLLGRRVGKAGRGLFIVNGKKTLVR